jgi:hypothetical protein
MLADHGIETLPASTAEESLKISSGRYAAAIVDVMLPNNAEPRSPKLKTDY